MAWRYDEANGVMVNSDTGESIPVSENYKNPNGSGTDGIRTNNIGRRGVMDNVFDAYASWYRTGEMPTAAALGVSDAAYKNILRDVEYLSAQNGLDFNTHAGVSDTGEIINPNTVDPITGSNINTPEGARDNALNTYYKDLYSHNVAGTGGNQLKRDLEGVYQREADLGVNMADLQFKDAAMNQATVIKQITDKVRSERMARLKSGMSAAQIANQDMQVMMNNVNALNENNAMLGQNRIMARAGQKTAKDQAFTAYMAEANARGQNAAAFSAADAGNLDFMTRQRMNATGEDYNTASGYAGGYNTGNK